ncbi:MAG: hypothetical protein HN673_01735 [Rhodospirillales bacterium]|jgi:hypothetical protein|nr:hypothetical protein [Rhodospirillales bacterium]
MSKKKSQIGNQSSNADDSQNLMSLDSVADSFGSSPAEKPVSLSPLKFEEALGGLLKVKTKKSKDPDNRQC